jgi:hypothetical protein
MYAWGYTWLLSQELIRRSISPSQLEAAKPKTGRPRTSYVIHISSNISILLSLSLLPSLTPPSFLKAGS